MKAKLLFRLLLLGGSVFYTGSFVQAQDSTGVEGLREKVESFKSGNSKFMLRGYAFTGLEYHEANEELSFIGGGFNPLFIYRQSDKLLFEAELETGFEDGVFDIGLEYANVAYIISDKLTLRMGKIFVPFGIFIERLHPSWINKFPNFPLGYGHDGLLPVTDLGIELRGGAYLGNLKYNYAFYSVNGPQLDEGGGHEEDIGRLNYGNITDNNNSKSLGGRIGIFPLTNSSLEIGISGQIGKVGSKDSEFEDISSRLYAFDLTYVKNISFLKSVMDLRGQANFMNVDRATFLDPEDPSGIQTFSFDDQSSTYFVQGSIRPSFVSSKFIQNLELAVRYSDIKTPEGALWHMDEDQLDIGLNYWLDWRTVLKFTFSKGGGEKQKVKKIMRA